MKKQLNRRMAEVMLAVLVVSGFALTRPARGAESADSLVIAVLNYAGVAPETLNLAETQTSEIFKNAGVDIHWLDFPLSVEGTRLPHTDQLAVHPAAYVRLLPDSKIRTLDRSSGAFGCAIGQQAYIFAARVLEDAERLECPFHIALGYIIAHEIGHVLLGPNSHAFNSVMAPKLGDWQFKQIKMGCLLFSPRHGKQLRERIRAQEPDQMAMNGVR
jgi:hypothetical protein